MKGENLAKYTISTPFAGEKEVNAARGVKCIIFAIFVKMPEMDGLDATRQIRGGLTKAHDPAVPIIAMTANAMNSDREECIKAGMNDYLTKPVTLEGIASPLERWLNCETSIRNSND